MRFRSLALILLSVVALSAQAPKKPKLVVVVVVDQFRYDYLTRFRSEYNAGLAKMLDHGAVFNNAYYQQMPTVTAVGHSIVMTGAMPASSGIVGNSWFDRLSNVQVTSVCDYTEKLLGSKPPDHPRAKCDDADPASPRRLLVTTVGDELRTRDPNSVVIGVSFKARSAVLPAGHLAKGAFWFDDSVGGFVSSTYYGSALPEWVKRFNDRKLAAAYVDQKWPGFAEWDFHGVNPLRPYDKLAASPWGNELIEGLAESAIDGEKLGQRNATDILAVSLSANDYVGHLTGPASKEVHDMCLRTDKLLGKLMDAAEAKAGAGNVLFVLTADHGVAPIPPAEDAKSPKMPGGYVFVDAADTVRQALNNRFGAPRDVAVSGDWVLLGTETGIYLNWKLADEKKAARADVLRVASDALMTPLQAQALHFVRVYTRDQLTQGIATDPIGRAVTYGFQQMRGPDLVMVVEPYFLSPANNTVPPGYETRGTSHSTPYRYDQHVPVIFYGAGVPAGRHWEEIVVNDIAPTLAAILDIEPPSGSSGHVLEKVIREPQR